MNTRDIEHIVTMQRHIRCCTVHHSLQIDRNHLQRQIVALTLQLCTSQESITTQSLRFLNQLFHGIHRTINLVQAIAIDRTANLYTILVTIEHCTDIHRILIDQFETTEVLLIHIKELFLTTVAHTKQANTLRVSITGETTGILQQSIEGFILLHLVVHRAFYFTRDIYQALIRRNQDDIVLHQTEIIH